MTNSKLPGAVLLPDGARLSQWLIATVDVSHGDLVEWLSEPHAVETDSLRTAGGRECHWAFEFLDGMRIGIVLREPYGEAHVFADPPDMAVALRHLEPLLAGRTVRIADRPLRIE